MFFSLEENSFRQLLGFPKLISGTDFLNLIGKELARTNSVCLFDSAIKLDHATGIFYTF